MRRPKIIALRALLLISLLGGPTGCAYYIPGNTEALMSVLASLDGTTSSSTEIVPAAFTITNPPTGGTAHTGFIVGTAQGTNLAAIEVAVDSGAYTEATGTTNWNWKLPTGPTGLRIGQTYTFNVRAREFSGVYSSVTSITIRKGINSDVNGDGYADLIVGASFFEPIPGTSNGKAYLFYGSATGLSTKNASQADAIVIGESGDGRLARSSALADINGDGYADVALCAPGINSNAGRVYIFYSRGSTGIASGSAAGADSIVTGHTNLFLGWRMAAADMNRDGYTDLAVTSPVTANGVYIFHSGGAAGIASQLSSSASAILTGTGVGFYGWSMDVGDINGDGFPDVAVGARTDNAADGSVYVFLSSGGALSSRAHTAADAIITGETGSELGESVVLADINGDGYQDLVAASSLVSSLAGRAYGFYSAGAGGISSAAATAGDWIISGTAPSRLGTSLAAGDIDGDGQKDLVIGAPEYTPGNRGRSYVFYGGSLSTGNADTLAGTIFQGDTAIVKLGVEVTLKDLNGDGFDDFLATAADNTGLADQVYYVPAPGSGPITSRDFSTSGTSDAILTGENNPGPFGDFMSR